MNEKRNIGNEIIQSMKNAVKYMRDRKKKAISHIKSHKITQKRKRNK